MERSQPFISESESSLLNESLLHKNGELGGDQFQEGDGRKQEIVIRTWLLQKYPKLFDSTIEIFKERSSNQELRKKASEYQAIKNRFHEQVKLSSEHLHQQSQNIENQEEINVFQQHRKLQNKIKEIHREREQKMEKIQEMDVQKLGNRLKIKLLVKIIKDAKESNESNPYANIDEEYKHQLDGILAQYDEMQRSQLGVQSQQPEPEQQDVQRHEQARRIKIKQQITKLQAKEQAFLRMIKKQKQITQNLKQEIKRFQAQQSAIYDQINHTGDISLKREILVELVEKFINERTKDQDLEHGLNKSIQQYIGEIANLQHQTTVLKEELQSLSTTNAEKQNTCILLEKRLAELQKQNKLSAESLGHQGQISDQSQAKLINNQEKILKAYMFEGNKMQSEISQMEHRHRSQEVDMFLQQQNKPCLECNQKVIVKKNSLGFIQTLSPLKNTKKLLTIALSLWFLALFFLFSWKILIRYDYLPTLQPIKPPRTIVHRYQGRTRIIDGQVVNISRFDENGDDIVVMHQSMSRQENGIQSSQREIIVVEPFAEQPPKTWKQLLVMEYK